LGRDARRNQRGLDTHVQPIFNEATMNDRHDKDEPIGAGINQDERPAAGDLVTGEDSKGKVQPIRVLNAEDILQVSDIKVVPVDVPEWGGMVYVRAMTAIDREKYIESMRQTIGVGKDASVQVILRFGSAKLAALTLCNSEGVLLFDKKPETIQALAQKSAKAMERVVDAAAKLNGLDDDEEKKKAVETAKKGSADQKAHDSALNIG
jgi:hypothetical protein